MKIIQLTVDVAFEDCQAVRQMADIVRQSIVDTCIDGLDAEVCDVRVRSDRTLPINDFSDNDDITDEQIDLWQATAREDMARYRQVSRQ